jgi:hypothetical protein
LAATRGREAELAVRWSVGGGRWAWRDIAGESGETYRVVFEGRRGGGAGPDFRDAVLARANGVHVYGDVELHLRPAGWHAHGHASDSRYNGLALHVVLTRSARDPSETLLANGRAVPLVVLGGVMEIAMPVLWPCHGFAASGHDAPIAHVLRQAELARFAEHVSSCERALREAAELASGIGRNWLGCAESCPLAGTG